MQSGLPVKEHRNQLHFGDNLDVLRSGAIPTESVDLIYLDPPFNSNANYNMLFREPEGLKSQAQIEAFEDTWQWGIEAEEAFDDVLNGENQRLGKLLHSLRDTLGDNDMMAYLAMMAVRLVELHRVLKTHGSMYLHCDPTSSHYLKLLLDGVFSPKMFRNELIWKRTSAHNDASQGLSRFGKTHDVIFFYTKGKGATWNLLFCGYDEAYIKQHYGNLDSTGRRYKTSDLTAAKPGGDVSYEFRGVRPPAGRYWAYSKANLEKFDAEGRLQFAAKSGMPRLKQFLDEMPGVTLGDVWEDIPPINSQAQERLGYPTQKPLALLERIIAASSNEGDVILDPFCGCGTAIHAAQRMARAWIGIDVTHLAISLIESRLVRAFPGIAYDLVGTPKDLAGARALAARNKHQFELWALSLVKAQPGNDRKKGADHGIDGLLWLRVGQRERAKVVVSVKGGFNVSVPMVRDLVGVVGREKAAIGLFVTLHPPTAPMKAEAAKAGFYQWEGERCPRIQILTVEELLDGRRADLPLIDHAAAVKQASVDRARTTQHTLL